MIIFLSWAGLKSRLVAEFLRDWLKEIFPEAEPWVSGHDIRKGTTPKEEIEAALRDANLGLACITRENRESTFIGYEWRALESGGIPAFPLIIDPSLKRGELKPPLDKQATAAHDKPDMLRLLKNINELRQPPSIRFSDERLREIFDAQWESLNRILPRRQPTPINPALLIKDFGHMVTLIQLHHKYISEKLRPVIEIIVKDYSQDETADAEAKRDRAVARGEVLAADAIKMNIDEAVAESPAFCKNPESLIVGDVSEFFLDNFEPKRLQWILETYFVPILENRALSDEAKINEMVELMELHVLRIFSHFHLTLAARLIDISERNMEALRGE